MQKLISKTCLFSVLMFVLASFSNYGLAEDATGLDKLRELWLEAVLATQVGDISTYDLSMTQQGKELKGSITSEVLAVQNGYKMTLQRTVIEGEVQEGEVLTEPELSDLLETSSYTFSTVTLTLDDKKYPCTKVVIKKATVDGKVDTGSQTLYISKVNGIGLVKMEVENDGLLFTCVLSGYIAAKDKVDAVKDTRTEEEKAADAKKQQAAEAKATADLERFKTMWTTAVSHAMVGDVRVFSLKGVGIDEKYSSTLTTEVKAVTAAGNSVLNTTVVTVPAADTSEKMSVEPLFGSFVTSMKYDFAGATDLDIDGTTYKCQKVIVTSPVEIGVDPATAQVHTIYISETNGIGIVKWGIADDESTFDMTLTSFTRKK